MKKIEEKNEQLDILNTILNNDKAFATYINNIEEDIDIKTPDNLENNILNYINNKEKNNKKPKSKIKKFKPIDILKIAACTILSVLLWQFMSLPPESVMANNKEEPQTYFTINTNDFYRKVNQFMFKHINIERGEN